VFISTVSLALRNNPSIPLETRQNVLSIAQELGYRPRNSKHLSHSPSVSLHNLGLIIKSEPGIAPRANPFYSHVLASIEEACRQKKINLLYATLPVDENNHPVEVPRLLLEESTGGLLLVGTFLDNALAPVLEQKAVPIVLVDAYALSDWYDAVVSDNVRGAYQAVSYLIRRGHRHIGLIGSCPDGYPSVRERRQGYLQALKDNGLTDTYIADCALNKEAAFEATTALLNQNPCITAMFGCNDEVALAAIRAAQALAQDIQAKGAHMLLAPTVNIHRAPLAGLGQWIKTVARRLSRRRRRPSRINLWQVDHKCLFLNSPARIERGCTLCYRLRHMMAITLAAATRAGSDIAFDFNLREV
jgi:LacI family transcriptional regulator